MDFNATLMIKLLLIIRYKFGYTVPNIHGTIEIVPTYMNWFLVKCRCSCRKVFSQLGIELTEEVINKVTNAQKWTIERILIILRDKIDVYLSDQRNNLRPEADQNRGLSCTCRVVPYSAKVYSR